MKKHNLTEQEENKLILDNDGLVYHCYHRTFYYLKNYQEDLIAIGRVGLLNAIRTFDSSYGFTFSTYASTCIHNEMLRFVRDYHLFGDNTDEKMTISLDDIVNNPDSPLGDYFLLKYGSITDTDKQYRYEEALKNILDMCANEREQTIVKMLAEGYRLTDVGEIVGCSRQRIFQIVDAIEKRLKGNSAYYIDTFQGGQYERKYN